MIFDGSYRPGRWAGVITPSGWLLIDLPVTDQRVALAWSALRDGLGSHQVLDALLSNGLTDLPAFALVVAEADQLRVVVRQSAFVTARLGIEERVVRDPGRSWLDVELPLPVETVQLRHDSDHTPDPAADPAAGVVEIGVPLGLGIAQARQIDLDPAAQPLLKTELPATSATLSSWEPSPESAASAAAPADPNPLDVSPVSTSAEETAPAASDESIPDYSNLFAGTQDRDAFIARLAEADPSEEDRGLDEDDHEEVKAARGEAPPAPASATSTEPGASSDATAAWTGEPLLASPTESTREDATSAETQAPTGPLPPTPSTPSPSGLIDGLPWLRSEPASLEIPVPSARSTPSAAPPSSIPPPPAPSASAPPPPPPPTPPNPSAAVPLPPAPSAAVQPDPIPPAAQPLAQQPVAEQPLEPHRAAPPVDIEEPADSRDESTALTISRAELLASLGSHGLVGPSVLAVRCPEGHLTPPEQDRCRVCGRAVAESIPGEVSRPTLGVLRSADGETVILDRDVVFGRSPQISASRAASQPNLVKVTDPGISRNHLHVTLDGWQVLVRDLGSSNGTEIQLPGADVEQIRAHEDYLIEPGTVVTLASELRYTFEVTE